MAVLRVDPWVALSAVLWVAPMVASRVDQSGSLDEPWAKTKALLLAATKVAPWADASAVAKAGQMAVL